MSKQGDALAALNNMLGALAQAIQYSTVIDKALTAASRAELYGDAFRAACAAQGAKTQAAIDKLEALGADIPELTRTT